MLAPQAIDPRNAYLVQSLMRDVVKRGTGRGALVLEREDLAGKTGTTNEFRDTWFSGMGGGLVATVWIGFDDFTPLGRDEFAAKTSLPIWTEFMRVALEGREQLAFDPPPGITVANIDPGSGRLVGSAGGIPEFFKAEDITRLMSAAAEESEPREQPSYEIF